MSEALTLQPEQVAVADFVPQAAGRITVLEALAEEFPEAISADKSHRSTQMGNGVDAEDD